MTAARGLATFELAGDGIERMAATGRGGQGGRLSGAVFVLLLAVSFATASALARLAYDAGSNPLTVSFVRAALAALAVLAWCRLAGAQPMRRRRSLAITMGLILAAGSLSFYSSFQSLPIATATLVYYTYPLLTGLLLAVAGGAGARGNAMDVLALVLAFAGLVIALRAGEHTGADAVVGIGQAAAGALGFALILWLTRMFYGPQDDARTRILWVMSIAALTYAAIGLALSGFAWPNGRAGVIGLCGASVCYAFAIVGTLFATDKIGPLPVAILLNFEPVASLLMGSAILGQIPSWLQAAGSLLVVAAIVLHLLAGSARTGTRQDVQESLK